MTTDSTTSSRFVDWLTGMTRALGYSRDSDLARALEVDQSIISRWRRGSRPSVTHLVKVSDLTRTQLEPLLVLAGWVPASAVRNAETPEPPSQVTVGQRMIRDSSLPADVQEVLLEYWEARMQEERGRLHELIEIFAAGERAEFTDKDELIELVAAKIFNSHLNIDIAKALRGVADAVDARHGPPKERVARGGGRDKPPEEDAQGPDSRER